MEQGLGVREKMKDTTPTVPPAGDPNIFRATKQERPRTPCGYPAGGLVASDGTRYVVEKNGQIRRRQPKMGKAELKRHKRERRQKRGGNAP